MMPFVRLLAIYAVVILAVVTFFQRDKVMDFMGMSFEGSQPQESAPAMPDADAAEETHDDSAAPAADMTAVVEKASQPVVTPAPEAEAEAPIVQPTAQPQTTEIDDNIQSRKAQARQAYWDGDMAKATELYTSLANDAPDDADVNGELGNILYTQGRYADAADYYFIAGKRLVADGKLGQVGQLIGVLQSLAPQKADELRALASQ